MSDLDGRLFIRREQAFVPADLHAEEALRKYPVGSTVMLTLRRPRNPRHHRKLFAIFDVVLGQTDRWADEVVLLEDLKLATGLFTTRISAFTGMPYPVPASISFAAMSQDRFETWYAKALLVLSQHLGVDVETLGREIGEVEAASMRRAA